MIASSWMEVSISQEIVINYQLVPVFNLMKASSILLSLYISMKKGSKVVLNCASVY